MNTKKITLELLIIPTIIGLSANNAKAQTSYKELDFIETPYTQNEIENYHIDKYAILPTENRRKNQVGYDGKTNDNSQGQKIKDTYKSKQKKTF